MKCFCSFIQVMALTDVLKKTKCTVRNETLNGLYLFCFRIWFREWHVKKGELQLFELWYAVERSSATTATYLIKWKQYVADKVDRDMLYNIQWHLANQRNTERQTITPAQQTNNVNAGYQWSSLSFFCCIFIYHITLYKIIIYMIMIDTWTVHWLKI